jgi:dTDP-4-dehydrorhamnose reductase
VYLKAHAPEAIVNVVGWADVDAAEPQRGDVHGLVYRLNALYAGQLARHCQEQSTYLLHVSTDYVFDGTNDQRPYREDEPTNPLCWYARTKAVGEQLIRNAAAEACIARIEMPFTARPHHKRDLARTCLARLRTGEMIAGVIDQRITPVFLDDAAAALRRLIELRATGTVHVASATWTTPFDFARAIASRLGLDTAAVRPTQFEDFARLRPARRPQHSWLDISRASSLIGPGVLRSVDEQLEAWVSQALVSSELIR